MSDGYARALMIVIGYIDNAYEGCLTPDLRSMVAQTLIDELIEANLMREEVFDND